MSAEQSASEGKKNRRALRVGATACSAEIQPTESANDSSPQRQAKRVAVGAPESGRAGPSRRDARRRPTAADAGDAARTSAGLACPPTLARLDHKRLGSEWDVRRGRTRPAQGRRCVGVKLRRGADLDVRAAAACCGAQHSNRTPAHSPRRARTPHLRSLPSMRVLDGVAAAAKAPPLGQTPRTATAFFFLPLSARRVRGQPARASAPEAGR